MRQNLSGKSKLVSWFFNKFLKMSWKYRYKYIMPKLPTLLGMQNNVEKNVCGCWEIRSSYVDKFHTWKYSSLAGIEELLWSCALNVSFAEGFPCSILDGHHLEIHCYHKVTHWVQVSRGDPVLSQERQIAHTVGIVSEARLYWAARIGMRLWACLLFEQSGWKILQSLIPRHVGMEEILNYA